MPSYGEQALQVLVGERLGQVNVVLDYLQLQFGDAWINAYSWPTLAIGKRAELDELRAHAGIEVAAVRLSNESIDIAFANGSVLSIALDVAPESAELKGDHWVVFGPK
ncbi:MAG TPA: hypothetical protein VGG28_28790 [Kofleriaceae bacterium]|jgi:hypothetical protein